MKEINLFQLESSEVKENLQNDLNIFVSPDSKFSPVEFSKNFQEETESKLKIKRIIEALLFAACEPVPFQKIADILDIQKSKVLRELIEDLKYEYISQRRSFRLEETASGYVLRTNEEYSSYIELLFRSKRGEKLSHAAAEVLAIIAYKQPITRPQIDAIRGVDSSGIIQNLLDRQLIEPAGKLEAPGRPTVYSITQHFLTHFGLKHLSELPPLNNLTT